MTTASHLRNVTRWLNDLTRLTAGSAPPADADERIAAYAGLLADNFPNETVFTRATLEHVAGQCRFFPSYGEVAQLLGAWWKEHRPTPPALPPPPAPPEREIVSEEQMARNRERVRRVAAELQPPNPPALRAIPVAGQSLPGHLSDGHLLATYEKLAREGDRAALLRLEMLKKKIAETG